MVDSTELIDFFGRHWQLSSIFIGLLVAYLGFELFGGSWWATDNQVTPDQAVSLYNHKHAVFIDIRNENLFKQGHVIGAFNFQPLELEVKAKLKKITRFINKPVIIISLAGGRESANFAKKLQQHDFKNVLQLAGGMQAWQAAGLPTSKG